MTPWISQALCECQGSAVLTHRNLRTVEKPVARGKCGLAEERKRQGGSRLESLFPAVPPFLACDSAAVLQPSPKNICAAARKLCCFIR